MSNIKNFSGIKIWGWRQSLIGDQIMALPLLNWAEKKWPGSFKYWQVARKCSQAAQLYFNHPLINEIVISDCDEGLGPRDIEIISSCHIRVNTMPQHPEGDRDWPNKRDIYHETALMAGLSNEEYATLSAEEKRPVLTKWFKTERKQRSIAFWPCAAYGIKQQWHSRHPSRNWSNSLANILIKDGYKVFQCGHPNDYSEEGGALDGAEDVRKLSFFEQIQLTLGCDLMIGTDSGSSLVIGAYNSIPQISLLTNHMPGHNENFTAFATNSILNHNFIGVGSPDNIKIEEVVCKIKNII